MLKNGNARIDLESERLSCSDGWREYISGGGLKEMDPTAKIEEMETTRDGAEGDKAIRDLGI